MDNEREAKRLYPHIYGQTPDLDRLLRLLSFKDEHIEFLIANKIIYSSLFKYKVFIEGYR